MKILSHCWGIAVKFLFMHTIQLLSPGILVQCWERQGVMVLISMRESSAECITLNRDLQ